MNYIDTLSSGITLCVNEDWIIPTTKIKVNNLNTSKMSTNHNNNKL